MTSVDDTAGGGEVLHRVVERTRSLEEQTAFYGNALAATPDAVTRYPAEVLRLIAGMGMGTGALAVIGGTVAIIGFLTLCTGALIAAQGYDTLSNVGIEALTGFLGAFLNVRFIAPATAGVALAATIGAGATAQLGAMRINEEIDALEVMGIRPITYLASTRIVAGVVAVIPIYTVSVLMSFLATRFGTTIVYGQSRGVYDHYFTTFLQPTDLLWSFVEALSMAAAVMAVHTYYGYTATGGPAGVGEAVGRAVRTSITAGVFILLTITLSVYGQSGNFHLGVKGMDNAPRRGKIDPIWWAPVLFLVIAALSTLTALLFNGTLRKSVPLTLVSDRAGLVMENGAKVKLRGVQIGEVASIGAESAAGTDSSKLNLRMDPGPFQNLPSNVEAEIKSSTAFGAKYVDLIVPPEGASSESLKPGAVLHSRNVTVEVNTVFENLQSVVHSVDPAKLNAVLSAVAQSVRGKGDRIGQAIADANNVLLAVNPRMPTVQQDWQLFGKTAEAYSDATQNILSILDSFSTTSTTITTHAKSLDELLLSAVGFSQSGINTIGGNQPNLVRAMNILDPTTALFMRYSPTYRCLFQGAQWFLDHGGRDALGGNGKSVIMDAGLLMGDDPYRYPDNLPIVNAKGGPGGKPSCGSLPDVSKNFPVKYLVTDTGFGTGLDIRPNPGIGFPGFVNYFPVTKAMPEPPKIRYPGGPAPGPWPAYPGAPPYGATEYGPDGTPLYPPPGGPPPPEPLPAPPAPPEGQP